MSRMWKNSYMTPESLMEEPESERFPSGRRKTPLGVRKGGAVWEAAHERLALTALRLMAQRGYGELVMDDVALHAGMSKRTVYRHYENKLELCLAAIRQLPDWQAIDVGDGSTRERVRRFIEIVSTGEPLFTKVLATALVHRETVPELLTALREHVLIPREREFARQIEEGQRRGEIDPDVRPAAIAALSIGMQIDHLDGMHKWESDDAGVDYAFSTIWPLLRVHPE